MKRWTIVLVLCLLSVSMALATGEPEKAKATNITYYSWGLSEKVWGGWLREVIADYEKAHPNIKVALEQATFTDKETVYATRTEAGMGPDVADFTFDPVPLFVSKGYLKDLQPFIDKEGSTFINNYYEAARAPLTVNGHLYAMPTNFYPWVLVYNTKLFREAGLDPSKPPKTMDELLTAAKVLTRDTNGDGKLDTWGFGVTALRSLGIYSRFGGFLWSAGGDFLTKDYSASALNTPEALQGFKFFIELNTKHKVVHPGALEMGANDVRIAMANGKVAMCIGTAFTPGIVDSINPAMKALEVLEMSPFPSFGSRPMFTSGTLGITVMNAKTKYPREAWDLIKYIASTEIQLSAWKANGWLSANKITSSSQDILGNKFGKVLSANMDRIRFPPMIVEWPKIADLVTTAMQEALTEAKTPENALLDAHNAVNKLMKK
jgi:multiple sugar transport system substrate-binding protein